MKRSWWVPERRDRRDERGEIGEIETKEERSERSQRRRKRSERSQRRRKRSERSQRRRKRRDRRDAERGEIGEIAETKSERSQRRNGSQTRVRLRLEEIASVADVDDTWQMGGGKRRRERGPCEYLEDSTVAYLEDHRWLDEGVKTFKEEYVLLRILRQGWKV
ncbi:hypothetical protein Scep_016965 [Stephania cephalantha]|uniref:Uncharacterized protein n=1 Tax=Stephania cephalantha TaxID=152367 RepID=A0AAP0INT4_9MAGN